VSDKCQLSLLAGVGYGHKVDVYILVFPECSYQRPIVEIYVRHTAQLSIQITFCKMPLGPFMMLE
jgi:hypothetical protein